MTTSAADSRLTLSTHVLDAALGRPAADLVVTLVGATSETTATTDADGRIRFPDPIAPGSYQLRFATGPWFSAAGRDTFYPEVVVSFTADEAHPHHHVAVLLSPYAYTTYRGS